MNIVFEVPNASKSKLVALLEADPYGKPCFSRNGYKMKDGAQVSQDREKAYVFMRATDEFAVFARGKMKELAVDGKEIAVESKPEVVAAIAKVIEEEENNAEVGFGAIFG